VNFEAVGEVHETVDSEGVGDADHQYIDGEGWMNNERRISMRNRTLIDVHGDLNVKSADVQ
jgi:hypothetical protein